MAVAKFLGGTEYDHTDGLIACSPYRGGLLSGQVQVREPSDLVEAVATHHSRGDRDDDVADRTPISLDRPVKPVNGSRVSSLFDLP